MLHTMKNMKAQFRTPTQRRRLANEIRSEVDFLFAQATANERNAMSYHDACKIADHVQTVFQERTGAVPKIIEGAYRLARGLLNPDKMKQAYDLQCGIGLLIVTGGGVAIVWGLLVALGVGLSIWASAWAAIAGTTGHLTGGLTMVAAVAAIVAGIYVALAKETPQTVSGKAHNLMVEALEKWAEGQGEKDSVKETGVRKIRRVSIMDFEQKYVAADLLHDNLLVANREVVKDWEVFSVVELENGKVLLKACNEKFVSADRSRKGKLVADRPCAQEWELFEIRPLAGGWLNLVASNGKFVSSRQNKMKALCACADIADNWERFRLEDV